MQRRERLLTEINRLRDGWTHKFKKTHVDGLRQINEQAELLEQQIIGLQKRKLSDVKKAITNDEDADKILKNIEKEIAKKKDEYNALKLKKQAFEESIAEKEVELKEDDLKYMMREYDGLAPKYLEAIKRRDQIEAEFEAAQKEVRRIEAHRWDLRARIEKMKKRLSPPEKPPTLEEKVAAGAEREYIIAQKHVYAQIDNDLLQTLQMGGNRDERLQNVRNWRNRAKALIDQNMARLADYGVTKQFVRPKDRPPWHDDMSDEEIAKLTVNRAIELKNKAKNSTAQAEK